MLNNLSGYLTQIEFNKAIDLLPLISIDLVLINPEGQILLGQRRHAPAKKWWFTPGGRIRKNESFVKCLQRIIESELGLSAIDVNDAKLMGVWDHFYDDSAFSREISTHYVNLPHILQMKYSLDLDLLPNEQHSGWRYQNVDAVALSNDVHPYVRLYAQWVINEPFMS